VHPSPGNIGRELLVQWDGQHVRLLDSRTSQLLREHRVQQRGRHRTHDEDKPRKTPSSTESMLSQARAVGRSAGAVASEIHRRDGEPGVRRILGLLGLARKHGPAAVDDACAMAMKVGSPTYRFVRSYLDATPHPALSLRQVDPLIRDLTHYRDVIARMTKEDR
jgi:hypothetical protein